MKTEGVEKALKHWTRTQAKFVAGARVPIKGRLDRHGLELLALAHHEFWRHSLVPPSPSEMVICHPNSPKCDADKMKCFEELQVNFYNDNLDEVYPAEIP